MQGMSPSRERELVPGMGCRCRSMSRSWTGSSSPRLLLPHGGLPPRLRPSPTPPPRPCRRPPPPLPPHPPASESHCRPSDTPGPQAIRGRLVCTGGLATSRRLDRRGRGWNGPPGRAAGAATPWQDRARGPGLKAWLAAGRSGVGHSSSGELSGRSLARWPSRRHPAPPPQKAPAGRPRHPRHRRRAAAGVR